MRNLRLGGGLHGTQVAAASRVLLLLDDGGRHGEAGHRLIAVHAPGICLCLHGVAARTGGAAAGTGGACPQTQEAWPSQTLVARYDAAATMPIPAWSNLLVLIELNWSSELLNHALDWGGNWLSRAKRG